MQANFFLFPWLFCILFIMTNAAKAAGVVDLQQTSFNRLQQQFQLVTPGMSPSKAAYLDSLHFIRQRTDQKQRTHLRMQQYYAGFRVYGGYAILHSQPGYSRVQMNGRVYRGLEQELGKPPANLLNNTGLALQQLIKGYPGRRLSEEEVSPLIYIDEKLKAHWAYQVSVYVNDPDKIPERPVQILDAKSFKPYLSWNEIKTSSISVNGMGYGGNPKLGEYRYGKEYPFLQLTRDSETESCAMENEFVKVIDMEHGYFALDRAMKFNCNAMENNDSFTFWTGYNADGYDKSNGAYSVTNDALYFGQVIKRMFLDWYNIDVLSKNGKSMKLIMRVHFGRSYDNAFWDNKQWNITFGDGNTKIYPLVSLGISAHELAHGFTQQYSDLEYSGQSGGINESFSDMAAQAAEYYVSLANTWRIGAEILKETAGMEAIRYLDKPSRDGLSIDSADLYSEGLDVHYSSGVFNRFFYLLATMSGWNTRKAFDVMVKANMDYWIPTSDFDEAGCGVINAAHDLDYSVNDVKKSLKKVAINYAKCGILNMD